MPEPDARHHPGAQVIGTVNYHGESLLCRQGRRRRGAAPDRYGVPEAEPVPKTIYDNVAYGPKINGRKRSELKDIVEQRHCISAPRSGTR